MKKSKRKLEIDVELANGEKSITDNSQLPNQSLDIEKKPFKQTFSVPQGHSVLFGNIILNDGISRANYYACLVHTTIMFLNLTATTTLQPLILLDTKAYKVNMNEVGMVLAELMLLQTLSKIFFAPISGYLIDKIGRKPMLILGAVIVFMGYMMVPFQKTVFPGYAVSKLLVANGGNLLFLIPLTADYVHDSTKGKATGIFQALASLGSFLGTLVITLLLHLKFSLIQIHVAIGIIVLVPAIIYSHWIKGGDYYLRKGQNDDEEFLDQQIQEELFSVKIKKAVTALYTNGWLFISLVINTLARADYYIITVVTALWIKSFDQTDADHEESDRLVNKYEDLFFGLGFIANLIFGSILDKINPMKVIIPAIVGGTIGYSLILFANDKHSPMLLVLIITAGIAMPGLFNSAQYIAIKNYPRDLRGTLTSMINVFGIAGYLFLSTVGGYLYDHVSKRMPYFLYIGMMGLAMIVVLCIYGRMRKIGRDMPTPPQENI